MRDFGALRSQVAFEESRKEISSEVSVGQYREEQPRDRVYRAACEVGAKDCFEPLGTEFGAGDATNQKSVKRSAFFAEWVPMKALVGNCTGKAMQ